MFTIFLYIVMGFILNGEKVLYKFDSVDNNGEWRIINDGVMGGVSQSSFKLTDNNTAVFSGRVLPDNNGGFASVRSIMKNNDLKDFEGAVIRVKGDGKFYNFRFRTNESFDGYAYQAKFKTEEDVWREIKMPFKDFTPTFRGRTLSNKPPLKSENIRQVGILIADKQFGDFKIEIDWIKFY
jgi:NADH dehydrogenase [ubiquinone] 1 alpha subcomplex assembly factor 1